MTDKAMRAEAVVERGGKLVAVGTKAEIMKLKGPKTELHDLGGRALLPGSFDAHSHVMIGGLQALATNERVVGVQAWQSGALSRYSMLNIFRCWEVLPEGRANEGEARLIAIGKPEGVPQAKPSSAF